MTSITFGPNNWDTAQVHQLHQKAQEVSVAVKEQKKAFGDLNQKAVLADHAHNDFLRFSEEYSKLKNPSDDETARLDALRETATRTFGEAHDAAKSAVVAKENFEKLVPPPAHAKDPVDPPKCCKVFTTIRAWLETHPKSSKCVTGLIKIALFAPFVISGLVLAARNVEHLPAFIAPLANRVFSYMPCLTTHPVHVLAVSLFAPVLGYAARFVVNAPKVQTA